MTEQAHACPTCGQSVQSLGTRLRECRAAKNWTRAQAAEQIGVTAARWALWEDDHARALPADALALATLFAVAPDYFSAQA